MYCVHITKVFPENGVMKIGGLNYRQPTLTYDCCARITLHWSINGVVKDLIPAENPYAPPMGDPYCREFMIIEPLKKLEDRIVGGVVDDVYIVGEYSLSEESIILAPQGCEGESGKSKKIFYDTNIFPLNREGREKLLSFYLPSLPTITNEELVKEHSFEPVYHSDSVYRELEEVILSFYCVLSKLHTVRDFIRSKIPTKYQPLAEDFLLRVIECSKKIRAYVVEELEKFNDPILISQFHERCRKNSL